MTDLSRAARIWNRAALEAGGPEPRDGDRALAALLLLHGMAMNGGVGHATEALSAEEFGAALEGFRYFGFDSVTNLLKGVAVPVAEAEVDALNAKYSAAVPTDSALMKVFREKLLAAPKSFAPL